MDHVLKIKTDEEISTDQKEWIIVKLNELGKEREDKFILYYLERISNYIDKNSVPAYQIKELLDRCYDMSFSESLSPEIRLKAHVLHMRTLALAAHYFDIVWLEENGGRLKEKVLQIYKKISPKLPENYIQEIMDLLYVLSEKYYKSKPIPPELLDSTIDMLIKNSEGRKDIKNFLFNNVFNLESRKYVRDKLEKILHNNIDGEVEKIFWAIIESPKYRIL